MNIICYSDGWTMIPTDVSILGGEIRVIYKCQHCDKMILTDETYPCDHPIKVHIDSDLEVKRI